MGPRTSDWTRRAVLLATCAVLAMPGGCRAVLANTADSRVGHVLQPNLEEQIIALLDLELLPPDWELGGVLVGEDSIGFVLRSGDRIVELRLGPPDLEGALYSANFSIQWVELGAATPQEAEAVGILAASSVLVNDRMDLWRVPSNPGVAPRPRPAGVASTFSWDTVVKRVQAPVLEFLFPALVLLIFLGSLARSGVSIWRSPRRVPLLVVAAIAMGMLALLQAQVEPFLGDLQVNLRLILDAPGYGRFSVVWRSVLELLSRPWELDQVALVNRAVALLLLVHVLALLDALLEDVGGVVAGTLGVATSTILILYSSSSVKHVLLLNFLLAAAVHLWHWQREGRAWSFLAAAAAAACMVDLRPEGVFGLVPLALLPIALGDRWRVPRLGVLLASGILFLALAAVALTGTFIELTVPGVTHFVGRNPLFYISFPVFAYSDLLTLASPIAGLVLLVGWVVLRRGIPCNRVLLWLFLASAVMSLGHVVVGMGTNHRYVLVALVFRKILIGVLAYHLSLRLFRNLSRRLASAASGLVTAAVLGGLLWVQDDVLEEEWPHSIEYEFLSSRAAALPDGSRIVAQLSGSSMREVGLVLPGRGLSHLVGKEQVWLSFEESSRLDPRYENYLYLGTGCWNAQEYELESPGINWSRGHPDCVAIVRVLREFADLHLMDRVWVDAASYAGEIPIVDVYPLDLYRIDFRRR